MLSKHKELEFSSYYEDMTSFRSQVDLLLKQHDYNSLMQFPMVYCTELGIDGASCREIAEKVVSKDFTTNRNQIDAPAVEALLREGLAGKSPEDAEVAPLRRSSSGKKLRVGFIHGTFLGGDITVNHLGAIFQYPQTNKDRHHLLIIMQ